MFLCFVRCNLKGNWKNHRMWWICKYNFSSSCSLHFPQRCTTLCWAIFGFALLPLRSYIPGCEDYAARHDMPSGHAAQSSTAWTYLRWRSLRESHGPWRETTRVRSTVPTSHLVILRKSKQLPLSHDIHDPCSPRGRSLRKWVGADEKKLTSAIVCPEKSWLMTVSKQPKVVLFVRKGSKNIMMTSIKQMVHNSLVIQLNKVSVTDVDGLGMFHVPWIPGAPMCPSRAKRICHRYWPVPSIIQIYSFDWLTSPFLLTKYPFDPISVCYSSPNQTSAAQHENKLLPQPSISSGEPSTCVTGHSRASLSRESPSLSCDVGNLKWRMWRSYNSSGKIWKIIINHGILGCRICAQRPCLVSESNKSLSQKNPKNS